MKRRDPGQGVMADHRRPVIETIAGAEVMHAQLLDSVARTVDWMRGFTGEPMALLKTMRFDETVAHDPLTGGPLTWCSNSTMHLRSW